MKQELYTYLPRWTYLTVDEAAKTADRVSQLETEKVKLSNEIDAPEQKEKLFNRPWQKSVLGETAPVGNETSHH